MAKQLSLVIVDDDRGRTQKWAEAVRSAAGEQIRVPVLLEGTELERAVELLRDRQKSARRGRSVTSAQSVFDSADLLIVDYDLLKVDQAGIETGESIAYLVRCYSTCSLIVALNQFGENTFDLSLDPRFESFADVNIGSRQLASKGLWHPPFRGYRPWNWPLLGAAVRRFRRRLVQVESNLNSPILEFLGFTPAALAAMHKSVAQLLGPSNVQTMSFKQFAETSGHGLRNRDKAPDDDGLARIASAKVAQWLESAVLPGQDVLVDAPHLVRRFPSLMRGDASRLQVLNQTAMLEVPPARTGIRASSIESFRFQAPDWLSRSAWFWPDIAMSERISEVVNPFAAADLSVEFCEDLSQFAPIEACRQFASGLESPFKRRYVVNHRSRWAIQLRRRLKGPADFADVRYEPALRFAT
jgi:hypothetical protein